MKNNTELVFVIDRSGSMAGQESDTIGGFNAMLKKQQKVEGAAGSPPPFLMMSMNCFMIGWTSVK